MTREELLRSIKTKFSGFGIPDMKSLKDFFLNLFTYFEFFIDESIEDALEGLSGNSNAMIFSDKHPTTLNVGEMYFNTTLKKPLIITKKFPYQVEGKEKVKITVTNFVGDNIYEVEISDSENRQNGASWSTNFTLEKYLQFIGSLANDAQMGMDWITEEIGQDYIILESPRSFFPYYDWSIINRDDNQNIIDVGDITIEYLNRKGSIWYDLTGEPITNEEFYV